MVNQWLLIVLLACLPPYINKVYVRAQLIREAQENRMRQRREMIRTALNQFAEERQEPHE